MHGRRLGLSFQRPRQRRRPAARAAGTDRLTPFQRDRRRAGTDGHYRGAVGANPPSRIVAAAGGAPLAGSCAADCPAAGDRGVHTLRPRAGREKRERHGLLKLLQAQARDLGQPADGIARARQGGAVFLPVDFPAEARRCPRYGGTLRTQKSKPRRVSTLTTGTIQACEIRKQCVQCPSQRVAVSAQLATLMPAQQRYGYDLIA